MFNKMNDYVVADEDQSTITPQLTQAFDAMAAVIVFGFDRLDFRREANFADLCNHLDHAEKFLGLDPSHFTDNVGEGADELGRIECMLITLENNYNITCPNTSAIVSEDFSDMVSRLERRRNYLMKTSPTLGEIKELIGAA